MAVGKSFLDQYSVFCVFGSVVGCVVVPLITQSVESLIFSAIVISLTANRFSKKVVLEPSIKSENKEQKSIKGSKDKDINLSVCKKKKKPPSNNLNSNQNAIYHQLSPSEQRRQYQEEVERREYEKLREIERKEEEKREKKLKKKEERLKRKNNNEKKYLNVVNISQAKPNSAKEKLSSPSEKGIRNSIVSAKVAEEVSKTPKQEKSPVQSTTSPLTYTSAATSYHNNMNTNRATKKYDYYRPNIPRFARQAAKQRQSGYQQPSARSSPSPEPVKKVVLQECISSIIQPKVQSVIGCRKSPEPPVFNGSMELETLSVVKVDDLSGCYTLFGENTESKDLLSIIRQETGLQES